MNQDHKQLLHDAFEAYLLQFDYHLDPTENPLPYDFDDIDLYQWNPLADILVKDELQEITNILNRWHNELLRWHAWNNIISTYNEDAAWELRYEFLEALAHHCLLMPSTIRDTFTFVSTNSMHQVHLSIDRNHPDSLEGEPKTPDEKPKHLTRRAKENRLADLIKKWPESVKYFEKLKNIDNHIYRHSTSNYRNLNSHAIGPRLGIGFTRAVSRYLKLATAMVLQPDGTYAETSVPGKISVCYGFGGTPPLDMEKARIDNLAQYQLARECYTCYRHLLSAGMKCMPLKGQRPNLGAADA